MRRCVWSRNLKNKKAMDRVGPQRYRDNNKLCFEVFKIKVPNDDAMNGNRWAVMYKQ